MDVCNQCPRECCVDRRNGEIGFCRMPYNPVVARVALHMWEEPCISGKNGSGTIFFSGCSLKCVYCQNYEISHEDFGKEITQEKLVAIINELIGKGAHNINFVNPTHYSHTIIDVLQNNRLPVPVVYNCSGYEKVETLKSLEGLVDIYLTDLKYYSSEVSQKYSLCRDYFQVAKQAIFEMKRQLPEDVFSPDGMMKKGVIIRHLVLPGNLSQTERILSFISNELPGDTVVSLMSQYTPCGESGKFPELSRRLTKREYERAADYLYYSGIENGFIQEISSSSETYIPKFNLEGVL
ncbi:MAG: radical SAM protein [Clostridia bacterium]|nr:radical SAM protein [Clostridia bacterium]